MKLFQSYSLLVFLSLGVASQKVGRYATQGCNDKCGNVRIPYPFGIGAKCAINEWYVVDCNSSTPYLHALNGFEVVGVSLMNQKITVNTPKPKFSECQNPVKNVTLTNTIDLDSSPFLLSAPDNIFVFEGCGNAVMMDHHGGTVLTGCSTTCLHNCFGISCCQTTIPRYLKSYNTSLISVEKQGRDRACGSAFVTDTSAYINRSFSNSQASSSSSLELDTFVPVSLLWTLSEIDYDGVISCCLYSSKEKLIVHLGNGTSVNTWKCLYDRGNSYLIEGNPYLKDGCYDAMPTFEDEMCTKCRANGSYCVSDYTYNLDGSVYKQDYYCRSNIDDKDENTLSFVTLGFSITAVLPLVMLVSWAYWYLFRDCITRIKGKRKQERFFKRNGGILLKQQAEADPSLVDKTILFTSRELAKATDDFNENRVLGRGGQGTVYKGMLVDGRIVAVKKSKVVDESQLEHFINEVVILSQINHRNVVKLLGCCLETEVPMLVSEFISKGTLYDSLHNSTDEFPFTLNMRLQIGTEVAGALAYLHSAALIPIYHRDIKTTNILLDENYMAKVSDFGTSRLVSIDQTHLTTLVKGTFGYLDPEYFQSSQFTEKSDVYSFGVVLVELITGEKPISVARFGEHRNLATHFMYAMEEGRDMSILDAKMIKEAIGDELLLIANLAMQCLNPNGKNRPTMKEVYAELETILTSHTPTTVQSIINPIIYGEEVSKQPCGESTLTSLSWNSISHIGR